MGKVKIWRTVRGRNSPSDAIRRQRVKESGGKGWTVSGEISRRGRLESQAEWRLRMLLQDLQCLAAEPETLLQAFWFPGPDYIANDLAENFVFHVKLADLCVKEGVITQEVLDCVRAVDAKLAEMSGPQDPLL